MHNFTIAVGRFRVVLPKSIRKSVNNARKPSILEPLHFTQTRELTLMTQTWQPPSPGCDSWPVEPARTARAELSIPVGSESANTITPVMS